MIIICLKVPTVSSATFIKILSVNAIRLSVKPLIHINLYESTVVFIRRCAMQGNQKDDEAEEQGEARCFLRIR